MPGLRLWPLFLFVRLKNTLHISILRRYLLVRGTLFVLGRKVRQWANVWRIGGATKKATPKDGPVFGFYRQAALRSLHFPSMFKSRCSSC